MSSMIFFKLKLSVPSLNGLIPMASNFPIIYSLPWRNFMALHSDYSTKESWQWKGGVFSKHSEHKSGKNCNLEKSWFVSMVIFLCRNFFKKIVFLDIWGYCTDTTFIALFSHFYTTVKNYGIDHEKFHIGINGSSFFQKIEILHL